MRKEIIVMKLSAPRKTSVCLWICRRLNAYYVFPVFLVVFLLFGCTLKPAKSDEKYLAPIPPTPSFTAVSPARLTQIQERGVLIVGTAITAPFEFYDPDSNQWSGFDIDIVQYLAHQMGVELRIIEMPFANLIPALQERKVDLTIGAMYITPEREKLVDFAEPYINTGLVMVVNPDVQVESIDDLYGLRVGVKIGATGAKRAEDLVSRGIELDIREYKNSLESFLDLEVGRIDVVFNDYLNTLYYMQETESNLVMVTHANGAPYFLSHAGLGIAVHEGDEDLLAEINSALEKMRQDGSYEQFHRTWLEPTVKR